MERQHLDFRLGQISIYRTKTGKPRVIGMGEARKTLELLPIAMQSRAAFWHTGGEMYLNISGNFRRLVAATL
jgi:hypothetical protein